MQGTRGQRQASSTSRDRIRAHQEHHEEWTERRPAHIPSRAGRNIYLNRIYHELSARHPGATSGLSALQCSPSPHSHSQFIPQAIIEAACSCSQTPHRAVAILFQVILRKLFEKLGATYIKLGKPQGLQRHHKGLIQGSLDHEDSTSFLYYGSGLPCCKGQVTFVQRSTQGTCCRAIHCQLSHAVPRGICPGV